jgi:hypothetical protein
MSVGANVAGPNSRWTVSGPLTVSNSGVSVSGSGQLLGVSVDLTSSPARTSSLVVSGTGSLLNLSSNLTVGDAATTAGGGTATMTVQSGARAMTAANLTVGGSGSGQLLIESGGIVSDANAILAASLGATGTVTISDGVWTSSGTLRMGLNGTAATVEQTGGTVSANEWIMGEQGTLDARTSYTLSGGDLTVADTATLNSSVTQTGGNVTIGHDLMIGAAPYTISGQSTLMVGGNASVGAIDGDSSGSFAEKGGATVNIAGTLSVLRGNYILGACGCHGAAADGSVLTAGSISITDGTMTQNGASTTLANGLLVAGAGEANAQYLLVSGPLTVGGTTAIGNNGDFRQTTGTFQGGPLSLTGGGTYELVGGSLQAANLSIGAGSAYTQTGGGATVIGNVVNAGLLSISASTMHVRGRYVQAGGGALTRLNGGTLDPISVGINGGTLTGTGTIVGDTTIDGASLSVGGLSPGALHIEGGFVQSGGTISFLVGANGSKGFVTSSLLFDPGNSVTVKGVDIVIDFANGANPQGFLAAGDLNVDTFFQDSDGSAFATVFGLANVFANDQFEYETGAGMFVDLNFNPATGELTTNDATGGSAGVPEPSPMILLIPGLGLLGLLHRRRG